MVRTRKQAGGRSKEGSAHAPKSRNLTDKSTSEEPEMKKVNIGTNISEEDILTARSGNELIGIIQQLTNTKQDELFKAYKKEAEKKLEQYKSTIKDLEKELERKQEIINKSANTSSDAFLETPLKNKKNPTMYVSPIRKRKSSEQDSSLISQDQLSKELETIGVTLDMLELLTGLRIVNFEEDKSKLHFDVKQTSTSGDDSEISVGYRLVIGKNFTSTAEINYIPSFLEALDEASDESMNMSDDGTRSNARILTKILPDYFCDSLTFPYNTLSQFYSKMNRALNKASKSSTE